MTGPGIWAHTGYAQMVHFGTGSIEGVADVVAEVGGSRVLLVTTAGRLASGTGAEIVGLLGRALVATYNGARSHVPAAAVQAALAIAREDGIDCLVSLGGGSCADLAKAVAYFVGREAGASGSSYMDRPVLPHVAVPTTYSGAELTPFFGMTDESGRKAGAGSPTIAPAAAIYDPTLTLGTPARVSAETGMNCLAHGVEAAWSSTRTPEAEAIALACVRRVSAALPEVVADPSDLGARARMLEGAVLGGRCLQNATMGVHHGLSQLLGGRTGIPHGLANALVLAHAVRFNAAAVPGPVRALGQAMGAPGPDDLAGAVEDLRHRLGLPGRLSEAGVTEDDIEVVARMAEGNGNVRNNPRPVSAEDALQLLRAAL